MEIEQTIFTIITYSGDAKNLFMKAIKLARENDFELARSCLEQAEAKLDQAHQRQAQLIQLESAGQKIEPTVLLVHGQDHLMTAMLMKDMAEEFIKLYSRLNSV
ncbi:MAG: PTS lactose/cellobiose transporter subunit IIA [Halanaerobiales bacterium]|nr:PTS lactose/cellobiose transporter subunit IIA [Halanaerobiales bacterium]